MIPISPKVISRTKVDEVRIPQIIEPEGFNAVQVGGAWEEIEFALDSGATETVVPEDALQAVETREGAASRRGVEYEIATGTKIPNLGEKRFESVSEGGSVRSITAQVCEVNKALMSVKKVMSSGNRVVFDDEGSYIQSKTTGEVMWLREDKGMFMIKLFVSKERGF